MLGSAQSIHTLIVLLLLDEPQLRVGGTACLIKYTAEQLSGSFSPALQMRDALRATGKKNRNKTAGILPHAFADLSRWLKGDEGAQQIVILGTVAARGLFLADRTRPHSHPRTNAHIMHHVGHALNHDRSLQRYTQAVLELTMATAVWSAARNIQPSLSNEADLVQDVESALDTAQATADELLIGSSIESSARGMWPQFIIREQQRAIVARQLGCTSSRDVQVTQFVAERSANCEWLV
jgi:hypothetical protein